MATKPCTRCAGSGAVGNFAHVKAGVCFTCNGTGQRTVMRRLVEPYTAWSAVCDPDTLRAISVPCKDEQAALDLVAAWAAMGVPGRVDRRECKRTVMVPA